jgi:hypothetical protein
MGISQQQPGERPAAGSSHIIPSLARPAQQEAAWASLRRMPEREQNV